MIRWNLLLNIILSLFLFYGCLKNSSTTSDTIEKVGEDACTYIYSITDESNTPVRYCFTTCEKCPPGSEKNDDCVAREKIETYCPIKEGNTKYLNNPPPALENYDDNTQYGYIPILESTQVLEDIKKLSNKKLVFKKTNISTMCKKTNSTTVSVVLKDEDEDEDEDEDDYEYIKNNYGFIKYDTDIAIVSLENKGKPEGLILRAFSYSKDTDKQKVNFEEATKLTPNGWSLPPKDLCQQKGLLQALNTFRSKEDGSAWFSSTATTSDIVQNRFWLSDKYDKFSHYTCNIHGEISRSHNSTVLGTEYIIIVKKYENEKVTPIKDYKTRIERMREESRKSTTSYDGGF